MTRLEEYYNKFNEDKRLLSRHGQVEFNTTMHYIKEALENVLENRFSMEKSGIPVEAKEEDQSEEDLSANGSIVSDNMNTSGLNGRISILDIGAGTGRYSLSLAKEGFKVTALELVKYNLGILKKHAREMGLSEEKLKAYQGNALKLKRFENESFDLVLMLGPMYHLHGDEDKVKALKEALRVTRRGGIILVGYVMADYAVIKHGFMEGHILESLDKGALTEDYQIISDENELYDYVRLSDIDRINKSCNVTRKKIIAPDGGADYIRNVLNEMTEEEFSAFLDYQLKNAERLELLGASSHTVDILVKE